ncbi:MAG: ROK family protein [Cyclobacteriaceae bacterium]
MISGSITIGVDIGGGHILSAAVDTQKKVILRETSVYSEVDRNGNLEDIMKAWSTCLNSTISQVGRESIAGIAFAMPGPFNYKTGIAYFEGNDKYGALYGIEILKELSRHLEVPNLPMRFLNDATAFTVGEAWFGKAAGYEKAVALTLGTGLGSAFVDHGKPVVLREDVPEHGCLWHLPYKDGIADDYFSTRWFVNTYKERTGIGVEGVKEVFEKASEDESAMMLFEEFGTNMAMFLKPWLNKFNPGVIVLGGNVSKAFEAFSPALLGALHKEGITTKFVCSELMEDAALIGSARLFEKSFWDQVKNDLPEK